MSEEPPRAPSETGTPTERPQGRHTLVGYNGQPDEYSEKTARLWESIAAPPIEERLARDNAFDFFNEQLRVLNQSLPPEGDPDRSRVLDAIENYQDYMEVAKNGNLFGAVGRERIVDGETRYEFLPPIYRTLKTIEKNAGTSDTNKEAERLAKDAIGAIENWMKIYLRSGLEFKRVEATKSGDIQVIATDKEGQEHRTYITNKQFFARQMPNIIDKTEPFSDPPESKALDIEETDTESGFRFKVGIFNIPGRGEGFEIRSRRRTNLGNNYYEVFDPEGKSFGRLTEAALEALLKNPETSDEAGAEDDSGAAKEETEDEDNYKFEGGQTVKLFLDRSSSQAEDWVISRRWMGKEEPVYILAPAGESVDAPTRELAFKQSILEKWMQPPNDSKAEGQASPAEEKKQKLEEKIQKLQARVGKKSWWGWYLERRAKWDRETRIGRAKRLGSWVVGIAILSTGFGAAGIPVLFTQEKLNDSNQWLIKKRLKRLGKKQEKLKPAKPS